MRTLLTSFLLLATDSILVAQPSTPPSITPITPEPTAGAGCTASSIPDRQYTANGHLYSCSGGVWIGVGGTGGGGSVPTIYYASQISGVTLDCNVSTNYTGAGCTNNDTPLNALLATATAANPIKLIMNGGTVTAGLEFPAGGNVTIECTGWDAGFVLASASNAHIIRNISNPNGFTWAMTPGTPGQNFQFNNCRVNGNQPNAGTGSTSYQAPNGNWLFGLYLDNLTHVLVSHNWFYNIATYTINCNSCTDVIVTNNRFDGASQTPHQDGVHVDGPSNQIRVDHNWFNNDDDPIAMNAAEGYGGNIDGVIVDSNHCVGCVTGYRQLSNETGGSATNAVVSHVVITNQSGSLNGFYAAAVRLGEAHSGSTAIDVQSDVHISNISYDTSLEGSPAHFIYVYDNVGVLAIDNVHWLSPTNDANAFVDVENASTISDLTIRNSGIHRTTNGSGAAFGILLPSGSSITRADVDFAVTNEAGQSYSAIPYFMDVQSGASIGTLYLNSIDPKLVTALTNGNEWARLTNLYGPGVPNFYRNTTFANLPPATYPGLSASTTDCSVSATWGSTASGSSSGKCNLWSNGTNWIVQATAYVSSPTFTETVSPSNSGVFQSGTTTFTVSQTALGGYSGTVTLSCVSFVTIGGGLSCAFSPATITGTGTSTLTITASGSATTGTGSFEVQGYDGTLTVDSLATTLTVGTGPIQQWYMSEGSSPMSDSSGHTNNLTNANVTYTNLTGLLSNTVTYNGTTSTTTAANATYTNFDGAFSACAWIRPTALTGGAFENIAGNLTPGSALTGWVMFIDNSGTNAFGLYLSSNNAGSNFIWVDSSALNAAVNTTYHYCVTYSGSHAASGVVNYVNGAATTNYVKQDSLTGSIASSTPVAIGWSTVNTTWTGGIADVRIFNYALTSGQVQAIYAAGVF